MGTISGISGPSGPYYSSSEDPFKKDLEQFLENPSKANLDTLAFEIGQLIANPNTTPQQAQTLTQILDQISQYYHTNQEMGHIKDELKHTHSEKKKQELEQELAILLETQMHLKGQIQQEASTLS